MAVPGQLTPAELRERWPEALVQWERDVASQAWAAMFSATPLPRLPHLALLAFDVACAHATGEDPDEIARPACRCMAWTGEAWISLRAACYEATRSALRGRRFPLDGLGTKMLWLMVQGGCAAEITPSSFVVPYIMSGCSDHHDPSLAPGIVSFLLGGTSLPAPGHVVRQLDLAAGTLGGAAPGDEPVPGARYVRIDDVDGRIVIRIRASVAALAALGPDVAVVDPMRFIVFERACPHCGRIPDRYRVLRDGSLVCLACGSSAPAL